MIDFQMAAIKVTEFVCQSLSVSWTVPKHQGAEVKPKTNDIQYTLPQSKHSAPPHAPSILLPAEIVVSTSNGRRERGTPTLFLPTACSLATTSKLHPNDTRTIQITWTEITQPSLISNKYPILSCALCNISVRCLFT